MKHTLTFLSAALLSNVLAHAQGSSPKKSPADISEFTSVQPSEQIDGLRIPATHTFQLLVQSGAPYSQAADGLVKESFDFTGYVPIYSGNSDGHGNSAKGQDHNAKGYLSINHEGSSTATSGVSMLSLDFNTATNLWDVTAKNAVDFRSVVGTYNNCSGGVTPWRTVVTCEENTPTSPTDSNGDGYLDFGWNVEIDPATHSVKDQNGNGTPDKLWRMGRIKHENVVVAPDQRTVYEGADDGSSNSFVYKYVTDQAGQLGNGTLYVLKLNGTVAAATSGVWLPVPNNTPAECSNTTTLARALGATSFNGVEDVDISPVTHQIYFTAKGPGTTYRFTDSGTTGTTISNFEIFVGNTPTNSNQAYNINYGSGTVSELWRTGNDNLTFDSKGNLYILQDGGRNHVWLVRPWHTQAAPAVELFAVTPAGCEPTGMTLSPDEQFMFISMQSPSTANKQVTIDAAGQPVVFNKSSALVIARKETLGLTDTEAPKVLAAGLTIELTNDGTRTIEAADIDYGSTDNGGIASTTLDKTTFTCANLGNNEVTLTVTDRSGNVAKQTVTVVVVDKTAPTVLAAGLEVRLLNGTRTIDAADIDYGSRDNCGIASLALDKTTFTCANVGTNKVTLTVTDRSGNVAQQTVDVVVLADATCGTLALSADNKQLLADVYPNPVSGSEMSLQLTNSSKETAALQVFNRMGATVSEQTVELNKGVNTIKVPVGELLNGQYYLVIKTASTTITRPFIKQ